MMKRYYDFSKGNRGEVVPLPPGKTRITIRLDNEILEWFRSQVEARGGGSYQTMINNVLRDHIQRGGEDFESSLRHIIREELKSGREEGSELSIPPGRL
jgi:hypothetical protein